MPSDSEQTEPEDDYSEAEEAEAEPAADEEENEEPKSEGTPEPETETRPDPRRRRRPGRRPRGRRSGDDEDRSYIRWSDEQVLELFKCAAKIELPPNAAGWGQSTASYNELLGALRASATAHRLWGDDIYRLNTHKLRVKYEIALRQVICGTYKPEPNTPAEFMESLNQAVKAVKDKQAALEQADTSPQGRWEAALRRLCDKWFNAEEIGNPKITNRRFSIAKQALLSARRMTPFFDGDGHPKFPEAVLWNDERDEPEILSVSEARNSPHTARAFRESLTTSDSVSSPVVHARRRRSETPTTGTVLKKVGSANKDENSTAAKAKENADAGEESQTDEEDDNSEKNKRETASHKRRVRLRAELKKLTLATPQPLEKRHHAGDESVNGTIGYRLSHAHSSASSSSSSSSSRSTEKSSGSSSSSSSAAAAHYYDARSNNAHNNTFGQLKQSDLVDHCIGDGFAGSQCRCRLTRFELLQYGVSITGSCPDCHHKLSHHS